MAYGRNDRDFPPRSADDERRRMSGRRVQDDETGDLRRRFDDDGENEGHRVDRSPEYRGGQVGYYGAPSRRDERSGGHAFDFARQDSGRSDFSGRGESPYFEGRGRADDLGDYGARRDSGLGYGRTSNAPGFAGRPMRPDWSEKDAWISWYASAEESRPTDQSAPRAGSFRGKGPKGYVRSDERIKEDVCDRLSDDDTLDASDITVEVSAGEVTLTGYVDSRQDKRTAEDCAEQCAGVAHVQNNLRVRPAAGVGLSSDRGLGDRAKTTDL